MMTSRALRDTNTMFSHRMAISISDKFSSTINVFGLLFGIIVLVLTTLVLFVSWYNFWKLPLASFRSPSVRIGSL